MADFLWFFMHIFGTDICALFRAGFEGSVLQI